MTLRADKDALPLRWQVDKNFRHTTDKISMRLPADKIIFLRGCGHGQPNHHFARAVVNLKRFKGLADAILTLPMILPTTVVGFFYVSLVFTWQAAVIAAVVVSLPLMYRTTRGAFEQLDRNIIDAARTLGVSETKIFWRIMLPNARFGILAGNLARDTVNDFYDCRQFRDVVGFCLNGIIQRQHNFGV